MATVAAAKNSELTSPRKTATIGNGDQVRLSKSLGQTEDLITVPEKNLA